MTPGESTSVVTQLRQVDVGTAAALALGGVALLTASIPDLAFLTKPLSGVGLLLGIVGGVVPAVKKHRNVALPCTMCRAVLGRFYADGQLGPTSAGVRPRIIPLRLLSIRQEWFRLASWQMMNGPMPAPAPC